MPIRSATSFWVCSRRPPQAEAEGDDLPLPVIEGGQGLGQHLAVCVLLHGPDHQVAVGPQNVGEEELVAVPVGAQGLVKGDLALLPRGFPQVHEDLVLNAPGGVGGQLDLLGRLVGAHRLDQADGADGDQVLDVDPRVLKPPGDVHHQAEVVLDEGAGGALVPLGQALDELALLLPVQGGWQHVAAPDVHELSRLPQPEAGQPPAQGPAPAGPRFLHPHSSCHCVFTPPRRR